MPRTSAAPTALPAPLPAHVHTFVIGAGFAGLCAAIKLQESGEPDFLVAERGSDVGGTWRDNTYPGAACDVPSQLYSFSFAPNPEWSRSFSPQPEIQTYIQRVAERSGVLDRFRFETSVEEARWDERGPALARAYDGRGADRRRRGVSRRRPLGPEAARRRRDRLVRRRDLPLVAVAPRLRPGRQARRRDRDGRVRDPDRPRDRRAGRAPRRLPAHGAARHPPPRPGLHPRRAARVQAPPRRTEGLPHGDLLGPREPRPGIRLGLPHRGAGQEARDDEHRQGHQGPRAAGPGDTGLRAGLQADPDLQRLVPHARP